MSYKGILQTALSFLLGAVIMFEFFRISGVFDSRETKPKLLCLKGKVFEAIDQNIYTKTNIECVIRDTLENE